MEIVRVLDFNPFEGQVAKVLEKWDCLRCWLLCGRSKPSAKPGQHHSSPTRERCVLGFNLLTRWGGSMSRINPRLITPHDLPTYRYAARAAGTHEFWVQAVTARGAFRYGPYIVRGR